MITRDGKNKSIWQDTATPFLPGNNTPDRDTIYDVAIAGGGITGVTTGLLLQKAGLKCIILEANHLCFGTTSGTTAHLNTLLDTPYSEISKKFGKKNATLVAKSVTEAISLIKDHINTYKIECGFSDADAFLFAQEEKQVNELSEIREATLAAGINVDEAEVMDLPIPYLKAIRVGGQAKFSPVEYVFALAKEFENAGGIIVQNCRVTGADDIEIVTISTSAGDFKAKKLIYATHIPPGVNLLHLRCTAYRSYAMAFTVKDKNYPKGLYYDMYDPYHYYRCQEIDGRRFFIVGGYDHKTGQEPNAENCFLKLTAHCRKYFDVDEIAYKWSSQYFEPADGLPYIGNLPGASGNIYVASGFGGNGMVYSQVAAKVFKAIITNEESQYIKLFDPNRIKPVAGFVNFFSHNADTVRQFFGKWFNHEKLQEFSNLAAEEGRIVDYEGHRMGIYRDENNILHAVNPICTHMKCQPQWNNTENSWDCPCHGARYDQDGLILTGPADRPLEKIELKNLGS